MTKEKVQSVIDLYRNEFVETGVVKCDVDHLTVLHDPNPRLMLGHCYGMLNKMEAFLAEDRIDKAYRWLGFIQGVLWASGVYSLAEMMNHNRKDSVL